MLQSRYRALVTTGGTQAGTYSVCFRRNTSGRDESLGLPGRKLRAHRHVRHEMLGAQRVTTSHLDMILNGGFLFSKLPNHFRLSSGGFGHDATVAFQD